MVTTNWISAIVEHPKGDSRRRNAESISALMSGIPLAPFFDLVDADVGKAVEDAIGVLAAMNQERKRFQALPLARNLVLGF